jgi:signal transduction histidine kinase
VIPWRPKGLFWSLTWSILGVLLLTAILQSLFVFAFVEPVARSHQKAAAEEVIAAVAPEIAAALAAGQPGRIPMLLGRYQRLAGGIVLLFEPMDGEPVLPRLPRRGAHRVPGPHGQDPRPLADLTDLRTFAEGPVKSAGVTVGYVRALRPKFEFVLLRSLPPRGLLVLPGALIATLLGSMWIFRRVERRLNRMENQVRAVGGGDLGARISDPGEDELGQVERELNAMTAKLESTHDEVVAMETERRRLLADITHEISTPLTSIRGFAETLLDDRIPIEGEERARYLSGILHSAERMGLLLEDLLDLTRLEGGAVEMHRETLDLDALARHSAERHRPRLEAAGLELRCHGAPKAAIISADGRRIEQVVDNLLTNAARHVPAGGRVEIEVRLEDAAVVLEVRDDGPGFPDDALPHVFERFYRAEPSRSTPGSGLGLAIVREVIRQHGGSVEASNRAQGGARLLVRLPRPA